MADKEFNYVDSQKDLVKRYRMPLLNLWHHQEMDVDEFEVQTKAVDAGIEITDYDSASGTFVVK